MARRSFEVGMRVCATHNIIEADYHKGDRILAAKGQEGAITKISRDFGQLFIYVSFDENKDWRYGDIMCREWDLELITMPLDRFLHSEFHFAEGADQLERARSSAFSRLEGMRKLQRLSADARREAIEEAISLDPSCIQESAEPEVVDMSSPADGDVIQF